MACSPETLELPRGTRPTTPVASLTRPGGWFLQVGCREACLPRLNCARVLNAPPWSSLSPGQPSPRRDGGVRGLPAPAIPAWRSQRAAPPTPFGTQKAGFLGQSPITVPPIPSHPQPGSPHAACCCRPHRPSLQPRAPHFCLLGPPPATPPPQHAVIATPPSRCLLSRGSEDRLRGASVGLEIAHWIV